MNSQHGTRLRRTGKNCCQQLAATPSGEGQSWHGHCMWPGSRSAHDGAGVCGWQSAKFRFRMLAGGLSCRRWRRSICSDHRYVAESVKKVEFVVKEKDFAGKGARAFRQLSPCRNESHRKRCCLRCRSRQSGAYTVRARAMVRDLNSILEHIDSLTNWTRHGPPMAQIPIVSAWMSHGREANVSLRQPGRRA